MPKNTKGGKKHKTHKNSTESSKRQLFIKEPGQEYAIVSKLLGNCRVEIKCGDDKIRLGIIRGTMKKKVWLTTDDYILVALREFEDDKADIIHKYYPEEVNILKYEKEIPDCLMKKNISKDIIDLKDYEDDDIFTFNESDNDSEYIYDSNDDINKNQPDKIDIDEI